MKTPVTIQRSSLPFALALLLAGSLAASAQIVTFPDANLEAAIREPWNLDMPSGDITVPDMLRLTSFYAQWRGIVDTTGLETAANLTNLYFNGNPVTNYSGVAALPQLVRLEWSQGEIRDTTFLSGLSGLRELFFNKVGGNQIQFSIQGTPDTVLEIWSSTTLTNWTLLGYVTNTTGTTTFTDTTAPTNRKFYRAQQQ